MPAVSAKNIAFIYAEDLWVADLDGRNPRRLTTDLGVESHPVFSPDGQTIAFSAQYDGNTDVYTIPVGGGAPTRLPWHPSPDVVRGFTGEAGDAIQVAGEVADRGVDLSEGYTHAQPDERSEHPPGTRTPATPADGKRRGEIESRTL